MKKSIISFISLFSICSLLTTNQKSFADNLSVTVATAANVQFAMNDLKAEFKKESGIEVKPIISSSGKLSTQIQNGANFDIFMSADMEFPQKLYQEGLGVEKPRIYAYGTLVLWTTKDLDLSKGINILNAKKVQKIAIANPKTAPYGEEAVNSLKYYKLYEKIQDKFVYGESISQINTYINSSSVDIGFTAKSVVLSNELKNKGKWIEVDKKSYNPISQGAILLKSGEKNNLIASKKFYNFLFSKEAKKILEKYGYITDK